MGRDRTETPGSFPNLAAYHFGTVLLESAALGVHFAGMRFRKHVRARWLALPIASLALVAASPVPRTYDLRFSSNDAVLNTPTSPVIARAPSTAFETAPTPNRDISVPSGPASSGDARLSPGLFTRAHQSRGDGYLSGSTAQEEQDRRAMPGAGINLTMPLSK